MQPYIYVMPFVYSFFFVLYISCSTHNNIKHVKNYANFLATNPKNRIRIEHRAHSSHNASEFISFISAFVFFYLILSVCQACFTIVDAHFELNKFVLAQISLVILY